LVQYLSQGKEVTNVGSGILKGSGREGASFALINSYGQQISGEGCQAKLDNAGETGGDAGIEYVVDMKSTMTVKAADIVVRGLNEAELFGVMVETVRFCIKGDGM